MTESLNATLSQEEALILLMKEATAPGRDYIIGASLHGLVSSFINTEDPSEYETLFNLLISLSHFPSFTHLLASEIVNAGVPDMPNHTINKKLGMLVAVANNGVALLEVILNQITKDNPQDKRTKLSKIKQIFAQYIDQIQKSSEDNTSSMTSEEFKTTLDFSLSMADQDIANCNLPFELLYRQGRLYEKHEEEEYDGDRYLILSVTEEQWEKIIELTIHLEHPDRNDRVRREINLDNLYLLTHFISILGHIDASVGERLISFSLSFRKDVACGIDPSPFVGVIRLADIEHTGHLFGHGNRMANQALSLRYRTSNPEIETAKRSLSVLDRITECLDFNYNFLMTLEEDKRNPLIEQLFQNYDLDEIFRLMNDVAEYRHDLKDSDKIDRFLSAFRKYFDLIPLNQLQTLILERNKPFSFIVLRRIFEYKRDLLKSKCTYNNGEITFAVALILANKIGQGDSAIETLIGVNFGGYGSEVDLAMVVFNEGFWEPCKSFFSDETVEIIEYKKFELNQLPRIRQIYGLTDNDSLPTARSVMAGDGEDKEAKLEAVFAGLDQDSVRSHIICWARNESSLHDMQKIASNILDILEIQEISSEHKLILMKVVNTLFFSELHDFYSIERIINIIEKEKTTEGYVAGLKTIFIYRLFRDKNINHILKACEFVELGIFDVADYNWFLRLIKYSANYAQLLENSSLQFILGYFHKHRVTIKNTQPDAYFEYCNLVSDLDCRLQIERLEIPCISLTVASRYLKKSVKK